MKSSLERYIDYHVESVRTGDCDPGYPMLRYLCDRYELNMEQRYWLAFLYAVTYCAPTVFYIYNEFPDFENINFGRLFRWWQANKDKTVFQTDRLRIKSSNLFVAVVKSYASIIGGGAQQARFEPFRSLGPTEAYRRLYGIFGGVYQFGRFALFLYLEAVHVVTGFPMEPDRLDLKASESSANGLAWALDRRDLLVGPKCGAPAWRKSLGARESAWLHAKLIDLRDRLRRDHPEHEHTIWNIETTLCAYKKHLKGQRFVGFYINRQRDEIRKMQTRVRDGVDWSVLWQFRRETFDKNLIAED